MPEEKTQVNRKSYTYFTTFEPKVITKAGRDKYYVEGYASTIDEDLANEVVTMGAQRDILDQIKERPVTLDAEHEVFYDKNGKPVDKPKAVIPVGKVVDAQLKDKGVWIKVEFNVNSPRFKNIWASVEGGFLNAFSIAFYAMDKVKKKVGDAMKSYVNRLNLINITLTGNPCNPNAKFKPVMKTALHSLNNNDDKKVEVKQMSDNETIKKVEEQAQEQPKEVKDEPKEEIKDKVKEEVDEKVDVKDEAKDEAKPETKSEEKKEEPDKQPEVSDPKVEEESVKLKSLIGELKSQIKVLNEEIEKLKDQPRLKSMVEDVKINKKTSVKRDDFSALNYIK